MSYQFVVEAWTDAPIEAEVELQNALDSYALLRQMDLQVAGRELVEYARDETNGERWHLLVEGETNSPYWTLQEIRKAIRNHVPTAELGLQAKGMTQIASINEREQTVEDVEQWLKQQLPKRHE